MVWRDAVKKMMLKGGLLRKKNSEQCLYGKLIISKLRTPKPFAVSEKKTNLIISKSLLFNFISLSFSELIFIKQININTENTSLFFEKINHLVPITSSDSFIALWPFPFKALITICNYAPIYLCVFLTMGNYLNK